MRKIVILVILFSIINFAGNKGEISFKKQVEKNNEIAKLKEEITKLSGELENKKEKVEEVKPIQQNMENKTETTQQSTGVEIQQIEPKETKLFYDDGQSDNNGNDKINKLITYIKTQNRQISEDEIKRILVAVFGYSKKYDFNPYLVLAVMNTESHFRHSTVSSAGAKGLMQLMPFNFREFGVDNSIEGNIKGGVLHLKRDYEKTKSIKSTLVCYNAGCGRLKNDVWKNIKETREYIPKVYRNYQKIVNL